PQYAAANTYVGGTGMPLNPDAAAAAADRYTGLSSPTAVAKTWTGPRSTDTTADVRRVPTNSAPGATLGTSGSSGWAECSEDFNATAPVTMTADRSSISRQPRSSTTPSSFRRVPATIMSEVSVVPSRACARKRTASRLSDSMPTASVTAVARQPAENMPCANAAGMPAARAAASSWCSGLKSPDAP